MTAFYNAETKEPIKVMYVASSGNGNAVLKAPGRVGSGLMSMPRRPEVIVANGPGAAKPDVGRDPRPGEYRWKFTGLRPGSEIQVIDGAGNVLEKMQVRRLDTLDSYKEITRRFNRRGMSIDLDSHIDYVCYASEILGEGVAFRPKNAAEFKAAITDTQLFHHDDRSDPFGHMAASATIGEGYREVSTPSLHVAISDFVSSVHIDSYAFMLRGPTGEVVISPDVGQHIFDELLFRMPMPWLRRKGMPFLASVLQALHPVLPNSTNRYNSVLGLRLALGGSPSRDLRSGVPRLTFESTFDFGFNTQRRFNHEAALRLVTGGNANRAPDWVLSLKGQASCSDALCKDHQESVGLFLKVGQ
jgi:hypothetical protein